MKGLVGVSLTTNSKIGFRWFSATKVSKVGKWQNKEAHKQFFDRMGTQLGHTTMEDWYNVTKEDIYKNGGGGPPTSYYRGSPSPALSSVYPQHKWILGKFKSVPKCY